MTQIPPKESHDYAMRIIVEDSNEWDASVTIMPPHDPRLNRNIAPKDVDYIWTLRQQIQEDLTEGSYAFKDHPEGVFDIVLRWRPYSYLTREGMEYDLEVLIVEEHQVIE